ncbi:pyoverdine biosynthesis protein PvcB [Bdellovibrio sp. qaytius]|nr:pyoverdine biosynthesis protein PvcB [Bdellovibrio sp. qaytius]
MKYKITPNKPFGVIVEALDVTCDIHDVDVNVLRELVWNERLLVLRGFRTFAQANDFSNYCERWGEISVWPFGKILELIEHNNPEDHIFDNNYVPLHWDGMYRPQVPEFQLFHCVKAPKSGQGGRTTFSNTVKALDNAPTELKNLWKKVTGHYQRKMEFYDSTTVSPIIDTHPLRNFSVIRYNEPPSAGFGQFLNPPTLKFTGVSDEEVSEFHQTLRETLYSAENYYAHEWQEGDLVVADNFSLLHGREGFETKAPRHLRRVHVLSNPPLDNPRLQNYK